MKRLTLTEKTLPIKKSNINGVLEIKSRRRKMMFFLQRMKPKNKGIKREKSVYQTEEA
jgi:hypothetical protein